MSVEIVHIVALALVATALNLLLRERFPAYALFVSLLVGIAIFFSLLDALRHIFDALFGLAEKTHVRLPYLEVLLKILGIAYLTEFAAQLSRDAHEEAVAKKVELAGRVLILLLSLPLLENLVGAISGLLTP
ncbi:MAG: Stage III sporulation protein AD [Brockia lithotrophica]|uniref:Stage III sporulation protein AD n=1 Tax=Brockia lithotrophica TaxID=933949 RepID=A0A2T5G676_9BACL|nr:MAG: Stage III sporulation protein AD [Brockia lithotrophica]